MAEIIVGIDLGTTNSEVAIVENGQPRVLVGDDGDPILPSMVGLSEDGKLLVGKAARNQFVLAPERTIKSIKRKMGLEVKVKLGEEEYRPQEISAMILRALKDRASKSLGQEITKAVITVPAYFNDAQRQSTIEAGKLAGLEVLRILNEPTAASLTYDPKQTEGMKVLVYDLGGGTFDVSIVQTEKGIVEVLSSHGDTQLGGDDFDELLLNHVCNRFQSENQIDLRENPVTRARLLRAVENAKKQLSDFAFTKLEEEFVGERNGVALHLNMELSRTEFEDLIRPMLDRTMDCVQRSLDDAKLTAAQIDRVVLVGGSTRTPLIGQLLEQRLNRPAHREINPDLCVALGAAVQGGIISGADVGSVLVDITPHSLGIRVIASDWTPFAMNSELEYRFAPIIRRGTPLPASRNEVFVTMHDNQPTVQVDVYQGEQSDVRRNHQVGKFKIEGLAKVPAGNQIVVQLDLNMDGVLKVTAREKATGNIKQITIDNVMFRLGEEERREATNRLDELWRESFEPLPVDGGTGEEFDDEDEEAREGETSSFTPPQPEPDKRELQREEVQAKALIEKAERIRGKASSEDQVELDKLMARIREALSNQNWNEVQQGSNALADVLFYLEDA
jgi:molecular chaperone DnaK